MKYLVLGASGMAGHIICQFLSTHGHSVIGYSRRETGINDIVVGDVRRTEQLQKFIVQEDFDAIINAVGILNSAADSDVENAVFINSYLPHWLAKVTSQMKTQIVQMSTDCVFSGKTGPYSKNSLKDGESYYARTKALGELEDHKNLTIRTSVVGPDINQNGIGLLNWFMRQDEIKGYTEALWTGVTTIELAKYIEHATIRKHTGVEHLVNGNSISKFDLLALFNKYFRNNSVSIVPYDGFKTDKSLLPTINKQDYAVPSYDEMIQELAKWVRANIDKYPHYKIYLEA